MDSESQRQSQKAPQEHEPTSTLSLSLSERFLGLFLTLRVLCSDSPWVHKKRAKSSPWFDGWTIRTHPGRGSRFVVLYDSTHFGGDVDFYSMVAHCSASIYLFGSVFHFFQGVKINSYWKWNTEPPYSQPRNTPAVVWFEVSAVFINCSYSN